MTATMLGSITQILYSVFVAPFMLVIRHVLITPAAFTIHFLSLPPRHILTYCLSSLILVSNLLRSLEVSLFPPAPTRSPRVRS